MPEKPDPQSITPDEKEVSDVDTVLSLLRGAFGTSTPQGGCPKTQFGEPERSEDSVDLDGPENTMVQDADRREVERLRAENRRLREDNAILFAATSFFASELESRE